MSAFPLFLLAVAAVAGVSGAQAPADSINASAPTESLVLVTSETVDRIRLRQLVAGVGDAPSLLLRSASTLTRNAARGSSGRSVSLIVPQVLVVTNSNLPFSQNYGSMWAGRGISTRTLAGFRIESEKARLIVAPEYVAEENEYWPLRRPPYDHPDMVPVVPPERSGGGFVFPFYVTSFPIDQPMRFGDRPRKRLDAGQSSFFISFGRLETGFSNEHEWWGPGIRNAIVLSNNAPGFPHLLIRTARPLATRLGNVEARWLVGGLKESRYFDTVSANDVRSLASFAATLATAWDPNLSFGVARSVYATSRGWGPIPFRWLDVFRNTHSLANAHAGDTAALIPGGRDQVVSVFARWVFPAHGLETYAELGRTELPRNLRDLLVAPNHTQGFTLGLQWARPAWRSALFRLQAEATQLEQSATFRDRPLGSWYTSRRVVQGYTNRGAILGGSIGPGASSQWLALDYVARNWRLGAFGGRIRWNEDVHSTAKLPIYVGYCSHDVSIYYGGRAAASGRLGSISVDYAAQNRLNPFFQNAGGCPDFPPRLDIRNNTLSVVFTPFRGR